jgi:hypothetical protein
MKNLAILMVAITMVSLANAEMILRIVDNGDGTCGIWSSGYNKPGDDMYFALVTAAPPYPSGGYVTTACADVHDDAIGNGAVPLQAGENGIWGYIGNPMGVGCPPGTYIDGIQVCLGAYVKLYKIAADWSSVTLLDTRTLREGDCLIGGYASATEYTEWVAWGKPDCWCYARQCRGDINGKKTGPYWVQLLDLQAFSAAFNKTDAQLAAIPGGICADVKHRKTGPYRVGLLVLQTLSSYFNKPEAQVPMCDQAPLLTGTYNYFVEP